MADIRSFPNNQDTYIGAEDVMRWLHGRSSGVFGADGNAAVAPVLDAMAVTVSDGNGWLSNDNADGIVWWIDNEKTNGSKLRLEIDMADAVLPRIDRVVVSWETTNYVALPEVIILKGKPATNPVATALTNNNVLRQISLAAISVPAGTTKITNAMITDERFNPNVCGIVTESMEIDTQVVNAQFEELLALIRLNLEQVMGGQVPDESISTVKLANNSVTTNKIVDGSVTNAKIADGSVATGKIANSSVTADKLASSAVTSAKIASSAVTADAIASNAVSKSLTVTLSTSGWSNKQQKVTASGVTSSNTVIVSPAAASFIAYGEAQVRCTAQASNSLTFECEDVPTVALTVNVCYINK